MDIKISIPEKYNTYISENSEFQNLISEFFYDFVEKKQDQDLRNELELDDEFLDLNKLLESKIGLL